MPAMDIHVAFDTLRRPRRRRARRADGRGLAADLPDIDLRAGRRRPAARRLRVQRARQNPTRERLERAVAALEGGRHGIAFASGSAATAAIAQLAAAGEEIVVGDDVYGGTFRYFERVHRASGAASRGTSTSRRARTRCGRRSTARRASSGSRRRRTRCSRSIDIAAVAAVGPRVRRAGGRRAAARRRRQHVRVAGAPAAARAGRRHRVPLRDEVPRRALGHGRRRRGHERRRRSPARLRFLQNAMGGVPGAARLLPRAARAPDAASAHGAPLRERPGRGAVPRGRADVAWCATRARLGPCTRAMSRRPDALGDAPRSAAWSRSCPAAGGRRAERRRARGRRSARRRGSSRWASRWAASSR